MGDINLTSELLANGGLFIGRSWLRYLIVCGGAFLLFWVIFAKRFAHRRCQSTVPDRRALLGELKTSLFGIIFFMIPSIAAIPLYFSGHIKLITDLDATPLGINVLTFVLFVIGADAWFYWMHRLMHHSRLYRLTHALHHKSEQPSPLAGYAFSFAEAVLLGAYMPLVLLVFPINRAVFYVFVVFFAVVEAYVHLGFEVFPRGVARSRLGKYVGTAVFHDMHHENGAYNFAVYFTWWDRLMGTIHPKYTERYEQVTDKSLFWQAPTPAKEPEMAG